VSDHPNLPIRQPGAHLPANAYRAVGVAKVPHVDGRWRVDERTLVVVLNGLRRWRVDS